MPPATEGNGWAVLREAVQNTYKAVQKAVAQIEQANLTLNSLTLRVGELERDIEHLSGVRERLVKIETKVDLWEKQRVIQQSAVQTTMMLKRLLKKGSIWGTILAALGALWGLLNNWPSVWAWVSKFFATGK